jgi:hypothetical protein
LPEHNGLPESKPWAQKASIWERSDKEFLEQGRQIGSGPTESMCKATRQRVKGRGMRWDADNAEALMAIEALEQSGCWQAYWDSLLALAA